MRQQIDDLIVKLMVIQNFSKDIHYTCHGEAFFAKHLLVDKFDWDEHIDLLKECCLLGNDERPHPSVEYLDRCVELMETMIPNNKNDKDNFALLDGFIAKTLEMITAMDLSSKADENVIGGITQDLQQYKGLINLQVE